MRGFWRRSTWVLSISLYVAAVGQVMAQGVPTPVIGEAPADTTMPVADAPRKTRPIWQLSEIARAGGPGASDAVDELQYLAEQGDNEGLVALGDVYHFGRGVVADAAYAETLYQKAANEGDGKAWSRLGELYRVSTRFPEQQDQGKAIGYYEKAAELGFAQAAAYLGDYYTSERIADKAIAAYERAIELGHGPSLVALGDIYRFNRIIPPNYERADALYKQAMGEGVEKSLTRLAQLRLDGYIGTVAEGISLLEQGISGQTPGASVALAEAYLNGQGVKKDVNRAIRVLEAATAEKDATAARRLIALYLDGSHPVLRPSPSDAMRVLASIEGDLQDRIKAYEGTVISAAAATTVVGYESAWQQFGALEQGQRLAALSRIKRLNDNAYVYIVQSALKERGEYNGAVNGLMTRMTIQAINQLCDNAGLTICRRGPMAGPVADAIGKVLLN